MKDKKISDKNKNQQEQIFLPDKIPCTCNMSVTRPDGTLFNNEVTVECHDVDGKLVFSATTSGGALAEQIISATGSPHVFTISTDEDES